MSCYCGGRKSTSEECWALPEVSANGIEINHSSAKGYIFFSMVRSSNEKGLAVGA